jgi:protein-S-isoprenylcysteine O-methyltransferase Ste14
MSIPVELNNIVTLEFKTMGTTEFFNLFQLAALAFLLCLAVGKAVIMYSRGTKVLIVQKKRPIGQFLSELRQYITVLLWGCASIAYALPFSAKFVPQWFGSIPVGFVWVKAMGCLLLAMGVVIHVLALLAFGNSWRLGIDYQKPGTLVTHGIFAWTRNPIYLSLDLVAISTFLIQGQLLLLMLSSALVVLFHLQILREERFLAESHGNAYRDYCTHVNRYFTFHLNLKLVKSVEPTN